MAAEIQATYASGATLHFTVRTSVGLIWNANSSAFESFADGTYSQYLVAMTEQGSSSGYFVGTFPAAIPAGQYSIVAYQQIGGSPAETDPAVASGTFEWSGSASIPLSSLATSGQIAGISPIRMAKGVMVQNFPIFFVSASDGITPFTSGVVSGSINRDGGALGALQSGAFSEIGRGLFNLQAFTSGDLNGNTIGIIFTATGVSGGSAVPRTMSIITQRTSGAT